MTAGDVAMTTKDSDEVRERSDGDWHTQETGSRAESR